MRTIQIFNIVIMIQFMFDIFRTKRLTFDLPDSADDVSVMLADVHPQATNKHRYLWRVRYFQGVTGAKAQYIDLPKCRRANMISLTPMYVIYDGTKTRTTNRNIIVQIDY